MHHYDAYDLLSEAYREHLELGSGAGVVFSDVICNRISAIEAGAEKKDATKLTKAVERIRKECPQYTGCVFFQLVEALAKAEGP